MSGRKILIGCGIVALAVVVIVVIGGIVAFRHFTAPVPLPEPAMLADADTLGFAVVRLKPDDPWVLGSFDTMSRYSTNDGDPSDLFPLDLVWTARPALKGSDGDEGHVVEVSFSPRGRFFGLAMDLALWKAGRSGGPKVSRAVHSGEGITSFPGTPIKGQMFVRNSTFVWASDLDAARHAVDKHVALDAAEPQDKPAAPSPGAPAVLSLVPATAHAVSGAILDQNGSLNRCLSLVANDLAIPGQDLPAGTSLSFYLDTRSAQEATGEVTLYFPKGTAPDVVHKVGEDLARRLSTISIAKISFKAEPRFEADKAVLAVVASGLQSFLGEMIEGFVEVQRTVNKTPRPDYTPPDPN